MKERSDLEGAGHDINATVTSYLYYLATHKRQRA